jgi:hypothetical protein
MSITKESEIDKVEIVGPYKVVQVREATVIKEDGVELTRSFHRHAITPNCDTTAENSEIQAICSVVHTSAIKTVYTGFLASQSND